jgi:hypothetical protein
MAPTSKRWVRLVGPGCLLLAVGCAAKDEGPPCHPVRGKVLFRGKPAANVDVYCHPAGAADPKAPRPHGRTDADGVFRLTTRRLDDGAPEGEYTVTFFWASAENVEEPADRLQGRYRDPKSSRFKLRVQPGENDGGEFRLD